MAEMNEVKTTTQEEEKKVGFVGKIKNFGSTHPKTVKVVKRVAIGVAVATAVVLGRNYIRENGAEIMAKVGSANGAAEPDVDTETKAE